MKLEEFKAWFAGFAEGIDGVPTEKEWERIAEVVLSLEGHPSQARDAYQEYIDDERTRKEAAENNQKLRDLIYKPSEKNPDDPHKRRRAE